MIVFGGNPSAPRSEAAKLAALSALPNGRETEDTGY
jgi:hypothetical protein